MLDLLVGAAIGLHLGSVHIPSKDYNDYNPGLYIKTENNLVFGGYYNSIRRPSFYAGKHFEYKHFSLTVGAITGYNKSIYPLVVPGLTFGNVRITLVPPVNQVSSVIHFSYEWKL